MHLFSILFYDIFTGRRLQKIKYGKWKKENTKEARMEYEKSRKNAKRVISSAKEKKQKECANGINNSKCQIEIFRMAKQMVKERQDITGLICIKGASGKVIVDDKAIKDSWKEDMEKLMNEENEWDHKISAEVKEGPADCIRMAEVSAVLKKMKGIKPQDCRAGSRNDTSHWGYWNQVDIRFM